MKAINNNPTRSTRATIRCRPEHKKAIEQAAKLERARLELEDMLKGKHVEFPKNKQSQRKRYGPHLLSV